MLPIARHLEPDTLSSLATPANLRLGRDIDAESAVEIIELEPHRIVARVGGTAASGQRRTVELSVAGGDLRWSCTCTRKPTLFCKHCVAAALAVQE